MFHAEHMELIRQLTTDSDRIALLCSRMSRSASRVTMFFSLLYIDHINRRVLKLLEQIETLDCGNCEKFYMDEVKQDIGKVRDGLTSSHKLSEHTGLPSFLLKMQERTILRIDDKIENYWIGTDDEMKVLFASVTTKMNRGNMCS